MQLTLIGTTGDHAHLAITGEISENDDVARNQFEQILGSNPFANIVLLNLETATTIDSSGLGWLVASYKRFAENHGRMILHSIPPLINQVIKLVRLERVIECAGDYEAARHRLLSTRTAGGS